MSSTENTPGGPQPAPHAPTGKQGDAPQFCPHCGARDMSHTGGVHIEGGEWDEAREECEVDADAEGYQCQACGAEFYCYVDMPAPSVTMTTLVI